jgi:hypothetical protein
MAIAAVACALLAPGAGCSGSGGSGSQVVLVPIGGPDAGDDPAIAGPERFDDAADGAATDPGAAPVDPGTGVDTSIGSGDPGTGTTDPGATPVDPGATATDPGPGVDLAYDNGVGLPRFSFFLTSMAAIIDLSGNPMGFGGDLRYGETGAGAGLRGADKICAAIAERSMPGSSVKQWHAFLSIHSDENGKQVNAIDRIGNGPWYDRLGRLLAPTRADLMHDRPTNGNAAIANDFPNEDGVPNHRPDLTKAAVDNHDTLTGTGTDGKLMTGIVDYTCKDWTANTGASDEGMPRVGHSWPVSTGGGIIDIVNPPSWMSSLTEAGCAAGINILDTNPDGDPPWVGAGGGYGGFYCFALIP